MKMYNYTRNIKNNSQFSVFFTTIKDKDIFTLDFVYLAIRLLSIIDNFLRGLNRNYRELPAYAGFLTVRKLKTPRLRGSATPIGVTLREKMESMSKC